MPHAFAWRCAMSAAAVLAPMAALTAAPAMAQNAADDAAAPQVAVHYHDLDLSTAKGRDRLEMRLERAAAMVCGHPDGDRPSRALAEENACYINALNHAHGALAAAGHTQQLVRR